VEKSSPTQTEEETIRKSRARDGGAPAPSRKFLPQSLEKKDDGVTTGQARTLSGNRSGRPALRREQREQLESSYRGNRAKGRKARPTIDVTSTALGKERNVGTFVGYSRRIVLRREQCNV
jgi:hypothetical protein